MGRILIIGAGGVGNVAAHKCAARPEVFDYICLASRTKSKCDAIKEKSNATWEERSWPTNWTPTIPARSPP